MTDTAVEKEIKPGVKEGKRKKKNTTPPASETSEQATRRIRVAEAQAKRSIDRVEGKRPGQEKSQELRDMDPEKLREEYDHWAHLEFRLQGTENKDLLQQVTEQKEAIHKELLLYGDIPEKELHAFADMPVTYSAELLNNLSQSTLGIAIVGDSVGNSIELLDGVIHVPSGELTMEQTLEIARQLTTGTGSEYLKGKEKELAEFGKNIRELATYLAGQRKNKSTKSIFSTEEQQQAIVELYNAGVWLSSLVGTTEEPVEDWSQLESEGKSFVSKNKEHEVDILEFLFGKSLEKVTKGRIPTTYEKLLQHHGNNPQELRSWLGIHGSRMVRLLAPHIADSFAEGGKASRAMQRELAKGASVLPEVIFEASRVKIAREVLPQQMQKYLHDQFPQVNISQFGSLEAAAMGMVERIKNLPPEQQLSQLADIFRHFQLPGEISGVGIKYDLATIYSNPNAQLACTIRSYLLAQVITEAYKDKGIRVLANSQLLPDGKGGVIGHTRLQVTLSGRTYLVDPSIMPNASSPSIVGVKDITGKQGDSDVWIGDAFVSQESNMLTNMAAARQGLSDIDRKRFLQLALQKDPHNQMALLHLAALSKNNPEEQAAYKKRLTDLNEGLTKAQIETMLSKDAQEFRVALAVGGGFTDASLQDVVNDFLAAHSLLPIAGSPAHPPLDVAISDPKYKLNLEYLNNFKNELLTLIDSSSDYAHDKAILDDLLAAPIPAGAPGGPFAGGEIARAVLKAIEKEADPNQLWIIFQQQMKVVEGRESQQSQAETQFGPNAFQLQQMTQIIKRTEDLSTDGSLPADKKALYKNLHESFSAQYNVRTAAHDVFYFGQTGGADNFQQMVHAANTALTEQAVRVERELPGVAAVRRLYEQVCNEWFLTHDTIAAGDPGKIEKIVNDRFDKEVDAGVIPRGIDLTTGLPLPPLTRGRVRTDSEIDVAKHVGKNLFFLKTRIAHFVALGKPESTYPGLAIGNSPWDFVAKVYNPYDWNVGRYGLVPEHTKAVLRHLGGRERFNRILAVQDHDSSIWRTPAYIEQFDAYITDPRGRRAPNPSDPNYHNLKVEYDRYKNRQALFMRLYTTLDIRKGGAEAIAEARKEVEKHAHEAYEDALEEYLKANSNSSDPKKKQKAKEYARQKADDTRRAEDAHITERMGYPTREEILTDIIKYVPEELVRIYKGTPEMDRITNDPQRYEDFVQAITIARERCNMNNDGAYNTFDFTFGGNVNAQAIYRELQNFFIPDPNNRNSKIHELANDKAFINGQQNPLYQRVWSLSDAPFEKLDISETSRKLGGQSIGREMQTVQGAYGAMNEIGSFMAHPSMEGLEKLKGKFLYRSWDLDDDVRNTLFEAMLKFTKEDDALRFLMPGLDRLIGTLKGGGSEMQRAYGRHAEADDTVELLEKIGKAETAGIITHEKAQEMRRMVNFLQLARGLPLVQIFIVITIASLFKTAFNPKALVGG